MERTAGGRPRTWHLPHALSWLLPQDTRGCCVGDAVGDVGVYGGGGSNADWALWVGRLLPFSPRYTSSFSVAEISLPGFLTAAVTPGFVGGLGHP